jgi:hypothetical protein
MERSPHKRRGITSLFTLGAVVALVAAIAVPTAAAKTYSSSVKIQGYDLGFFLGKVSSEKKKCKKGRKVQIYSDRTPPETDSLAGEAKTDKKGKWSANDLHGLGGTYYAIVRPKTLANAKCAHAQSPPFVR